MKLSSASLVTVLLHLSPLLLSLALPQAHALGDTTTTSSSASSTEASGSIPQATCSSVDDPQCVEDASSTSSTELKNSENEASSKTSKSVNTTATDGSTSSTDHGFSQSDFETCGLWLAPSTIPNAGLGLFAGNDISAGTTIGEEDLFITIVDKYKTLPYRGNQRFLSWLGYVYPVKPEIFWPMTENAFPPIHPSHYLIDEGLNAATGMPFLDALADPVSAFVPGIASMANSQQEMANMDRDPMSHETDWPYPVPPPYTPNHGVTFQATRDIALGSELFLDYGDAWHDRYDAKHGEGFVEFETSPKAYMEQNNITVPTEKDKRDKLPKMEEVLKKKLYQQFQDKLLGEAKQRSEIDGHGHGPGASSGSSTILKTTGSDGLYEEETLVTTSTTTTTATETSEFATTHVETKVSVTTTTTTQYTKADDDEEEEKASALRTNNSTMLEFPIGISVMDEFAPGHWLSGSITDYDEDDQVYRVTFENGHTEDYSDEQEMRNIVDSAIDVKETRVRNGWDERLSDRATYQQETGGQQAKRSPQWLYKNGLCIDSLRSGPSTIPAAGRGAFAKRAIAKGGVIASAPLLALKRDDLVIYEADESTTIHRNVLKLDKVLGQEMMLNYAYGKPSSPLLLVPFAPVVNFINHNGQEPNAMIRWPETSSPQLFRDAKEWLELHPLDVIDQSGKLMMEFVALTEIQPGQEIFIDYGKAWEQAWDAYQRSDQEKEFRHEIEVPPSFYPEKWDQEAVYKVANANRHLEPGEIDELRWEHNGERVAEGVMRVGLPKGFSAKMREYAEERGITGLYQRLVSDTYLENDGWHVLQMNAEEQWFAHRYMNKAWRFNMHYVAAWDEAARASVYRKMMSEGFGEALAGLGKHFGLNHTTCFHFSWMGLSEADNSLTHADVYASGKKAYNLIYPIITVDGTKPELDVISDNVNLEISVKYQHDIAYVLGDWGYHKTSPNDNEGGQLRLVAGTYCGQIDETNSEMLAHIYDGEDPAPFMTQFQLPLREFHWRASESDPQ